MPRACNSSTKALSGMDESQERRKEKENGAQKMVKAVHVLHCGLVPSTAVLIWRVCNVSSALLCFVFKELLQIQRKKNVAFVPI